ncbi:hypothetical protein [Haloferula sargassicola]|uniref:Uncharacterized protein n=1 Tax=Haloferula sargassicola TaxID=490096 RepID=A0ABP9UK82_9BACT
MRKTHRSKPDRLPITAAGFLLSLGTLSHATTLEVGVNFRGSSTDMAPADSAGAPSYEQTNWNNLGDRGGPTALNDANGAATAIQIQWDCPGSWGDGGNPGTTPDQKLMKGYLDSNGTVNGLFDGFGSNDDEPLILLTGLDTWMSANGFTSYSIVVYTDGDDATGQRATRVWLASTGGNDSPPDLGANTTPVRELLDAANFGTTTTYVEVPSGSGTGNFTAFKLQSSPAVYIRTEEGGTDPFRAPINAIQIIGTDDTPVDTDNDGLPDEWEIMWGLDPADDGTVDPANGAAGDPDEDGLSNADEYNGGSESSNPISADSDEDGLGDKEEFDLGTDPVYRDSDFDGLSDGWEVTYSLDPLDDGSVNVDNGDAGDPDGDNLDNLAEFELGTDPRNMDTDNDGYDDGVEDTFGLWGGENFTGTDPLLADTDSDGFLDGAENPDNDHVPGSVLGTDPNLEDTDGDGVNDRWEVVLGLDPTDDSPAESLPTVALLNASFEQPATGTFTYGQPTSWTLDPAPPSQDAVYVENMSSVGMMGGEGINMAAIQLTDAVLYQDTGVNFQPNTTYIVDLAGGARTGWPTGLMEFGLREGTGSGSGTALPGYAGKLDLGGIASDSGNPDADGRLDRLRSASVVSNLGSGALGQPYSFVTGDTPPTGTLVAYVRKVTDENRVYFDNFRILAVPNSLDGDSDGLPDAWELANRLDPTDGTGDQGAAGDLDMDGFTNEEELAAGTNPADAASAPVVGSPMIVSAAFNGTAFEISVENLQASESYRLMRSLTLSDFAPLGDAVTGVSSHTFSDPAPPADKAFYRIQSEP